MPGLMYSFLPTTPRERLIFALDVEDLDAAERFVRLLAPHVGMFKVGSQLFASAGPLVVDLIQGMGASVFLDLKFHDIPATVAGAAREAARQRARMFTVHALGGRAMIRKATSELARMTVVPGIPPTMCLAVTLLTSHTNEELTDLGFTSPLVEQTTRLAKLAIDAGAGGIVASAQELPRLREVLPPHTIYVTPGIRNEGDALNDQARVATARQAIAAGSTYLVVGRPIRDAPDPAEAAQKILEEIRDAAPPS